jgi:hypothetical protein
MKEIKSKLPVDEVSFDTVVSNIKAVTEYTNEIEFQDDMYFVSDMKESYINVKSFGIPSLNGKCVGNLKLLLDRITPIRDQKVIVKEIDSNKVIFKTDTTEVGFSFTIPESIKNNRIIKIMNGEETIYKAKQIYDGLVNALKDLPKISVELSRGEIDNIIKMVKSYRSSRFWFVIRDMALYAKVEDVNKNYTILKICDLETTETGEYLIQTLPSTSETGWTLSFFISTANKCVEWSKEDINIISILPKAPKI